MNEEFDEQWYWQRVDELFSEIFGAQNFQSFSDITTMDEIERADAEFEMLGRDVSLANEMLKNIGVNVQ